MSSTPDNESRPHALVQELLGSVCRCGSAKTPRQTFCGSCYRSLSYRLRRPLYKRIGEGYEAAYQEAADFLRAAGRTA